MEKQYLILATGEKNDDTGVIFITAESEKEALDKFLFEHNDFDKEDESPMVNSMMEDNPVGIAHIESMDDMANPSVEWYYTYTE